MEVKACLRHLIVSGGIVFPLQVLNLLCRLNYKAVVLVKCSVEPCSEVGHGYPFSNYDTENAGNSV